MTLVLHHAWDAVCPIKVRMCLAEKGLTWKSVPYSIAAFEHLAPDYLAINPNGTVPTLVDGERVIFESSVINEYLDDIGPGPPFKPADPAERAQMRMWVKFQDDVLHPATRPHTFSLILLHPESPMARLSNEEMEARLAKHPDPNRLAMFRQMGRTSAPPAALALAEAALGRALDRLERGLADGRPWLAGNSFSLADIAMAGVIDRIQYCGLGHLWEARPSTGAWVDRLQARAAYRAALPDSAQRMPGPLTAWPN